MLRLCRSILLIFHSRCSFFLTFYKLLRSSHFQQTGLIQHHPLSWVKLTVAESEINPTFLEKVYSFHSLVSKGLWHLYDPEDRGPGTSTQQILFNPSFAGSIVLDVDLGAFIPEHSQAREQLGYFKELAERAEKGYCILIISSLIS